MTAEVERLKGGEGQRALNVLSELLEQEGCQPDFVNAKTRGHRPPANTALHLACKANMLGGSQTVALLLGAKAQRAPNGLQETVCRRAWFLCFQIVDYNI